MFEPYYPNKWGITPEMDLGQLPMFIAVIKGLKPAMTGVINQDSYTKLKEFCKKFNLSLIISDYKLINPPEELLKELKQKQKLPTTRNICVPLSNPNNGNIYFYISREEKDAINAKKFHWENQIINGRIVSTSFVDHINFGYAMGYPDCCIKKFINTLLMRLNPTERAFIETKGKFSFYTNNLPMDHYYFLTHHHPCSFRCKKTIKKSKELLKAIKEDDEILAKKIEYHLKLPFLVMEEKLSIAFQGKIKNEEIYYKNCYLIGNPTDKLFFNKFKWRNRIRITDEEIKIYKNDFLLEIINKKNKFNGFILKF